MTTIKKVINGNKASIGIATVVIIFAFLLICPYTKAQTNISFTPADKFSIPAYNGTISFAVNGTYSNATFENNTWIFTNLLLNRSRLLENFVISTKNSNVTIRSYGTTSNTEVQSATLRCVVEGHGEQILNFGLGSGKGELEWFISFDGSSAGLGEGQGWTVLHNGTIVLTGTTGKLNIVRYDYFVSSSNLPFYQQDSVAIMTAIIIAVTVIIALVIEVKTREHSNENGLVKNAYSNHQRLSINQIIGRTSDGV